MTLYRGAKIGLKTQCGGAFYTQDINIAESYAELEEGVVYEFNPKVNLFDATNLFDFDYGIEEMMEDVDNWEEIINNYDGVFERDGVQVILFGTLDNEDKFTKLSVNNLLIDVKSSFRRYDR